MNIFELRFEFKKHKPIVLLFPYKLSNMKKCFLFLCLLLSISSFAIIRLPKLFADDMVLQRNKLIPVWGWADANEKIEIHFNKQIKTTIADANGKWFLKLDAEKAGGPYELSISGANKIILKNILVGEVWICSGQSNMEFSVSQADNAAAEIAAANYPMIRQFKVGKDLSSLPKEDFKAGSWQICTKASAGDFTAVGYFFAKKIQEELGIPIGIINTSWGGTVSETWTSREAFENSSEFAAMIAEMPKVDLDSISKVFIAKSTQRIERLQGSEINVAATSRFKELDYNDQNWPELNAAEVWESQELGEFDGVVWLRKEITIPANDLGEPALLELAKIDDEDISYINGIEVGRNTNWEAKRKYEIPAGVLKVGQNIIAIRIVDNSGGGGIYGDSGDLKLTIGSTQIPLAGKWKYQVESIKSEISPNAYPSLLYNAMLHPLIPYAFEGVLWYQGESNANRAYQYRTAFPLLINDWRAKWKQGDFPFYYVQLASFNEANGNSNNGSYWAELREAQTLTLKLANTGMCVTTDIGIPNNIHPTNKQDVGKRLAAIALNKVYKKNNIYGGPRFKMMQIRANEIVIQFENTGSGLSTSDKNNLIKGFEIAGKDQIFHPAKAVIHANQLIISSENCTNPLAVHYGWADDASAGNLYNKEGFPAEPFRTDDWKTLSKKVKYKIVK